MSFDPVKDFQPITPIISFPHILVVPPDSPVKTVSRPRGAGEDQARRLELRLAGRRLRRADSGRDVQGPARRADGARAVPGRGPGRDRHHGRAARFPVHAPTSRSASRPRPASFASSPSAGQKRIDAEPGDADHGGGGLPRPRPRNVARHGGARRHARRRSCKRLNDGIHQGDARARTSCASSSRRRPTCSSARPTNSANGSPPTRSGSARSSAPPGSRRNRRKKRPGRCRPGRYRDLDESALSAASRRCR